MNQLLCQVLSFVRGIVRDDSHDAGPYVLEEQIGEGGMGVVYRARHARRCALAAVKLLSATAAGDEMRARLFAREVEVTSRLRHPNTIAVYDSGRMRDGTPYLAMEYVEGRTLAELIAADGAQSASRVVHLLKQIASALSEVHAAGFVHRDIKPSNVMLTARDDIKVLDFGLVTEARSSVDTQGESPRPTGPKPLMGTPLYMAPEAIEDPDAVDGRADLYALGAVGYFLLTGGSTFEGTTTLVETFLKQLFEDPVRPSLRTTKPIPVDLEDLIMACLSRDPKERPKNALEVGMRLAVIAQTFVSSGGTFEGMPAAGPALGSTLPAVAGATSSP